jgi:uncharacterized metal-binding protein
MDFNQIMAVVLREIVSPAVWLLMAAAFVYFLWGVVKYIWKGSSPEARHDGQRHMFWGIIGLAIMVSVFGIMHFLFGTITDIGGTTGISNKPVAEPTINKGFDAFEQPQP